MAYKLVKHRKIKEHTRHLEVLVNPEAPEKEQIIEVFNWGMDIPLEIVRTETKLLLDTKYNISEEVLPGENTEL